MKDNDILESAKTALIDRNYESNLNLKPSLLVNNNNNKLLSIIIDELETCECFKFSAAFITLSGVQPLKETLNYLQERNVPGKILTTDYLYFTEPKAIEFLNAFKNIEIKIFKHDKQGFHTKGYLFKKNGNYTGIVGSSNLTSNALNQNEEWNIGFTSAYDGELLNNLNNEFNKLWDEAFSYDDYFIEYEHIYNKSRSYENLKIITNDAIDEISKNKHDVKPNDMQIEFLNKMDGLIEREENKAILVSATGTGKTCAAAFEVRRRNPRKFLFLVHRFQILKQAKETFKKVLNDDSLTFGCLGGGYHDSDVDFLFSTFQSLNNKKRYKQFNKDEFDYIVVDEVHKSGADTYKNIISYFSPQFLLGMTATPWRSDDKDIFELFDNNIVHEVTLQDALNNNLICPFHYYGIRDEKNVGIYAKDSTENFNCLTSEERAKHILEKSKEYGYSGDRIKSLVFCSSLKEAKELAKIFTRKGSPSLALSGKVNNEGRKDAIDRLVNDKRKDKLEYILSYDIFNEGIDIPKVNQVILIRPTKSAIVFTQQLGRGLRKDKSKDFVVILDFIGNYKNNYLIPIALSGMKRYTKDDLRKFIMSRTKIIEGSSSISFDEISRSRIFKAIDSSNFSQKYDLRDKYLIFKRKFGKVPMLCDIQKSDDFEPSLIFKHDDFPNYYEFLKYCHSNDIEFNDVLDEKYMYSLNFISLELSKGIRPHELIILNLLKSNKYFTVNNVKKILKEKYGLINQLDNIKSAISVLNFSHYLTNENKYRSEIKNKFISNEYSPQNTFFKSNRNIIKKLNENLEYKFEISNIFNELLKNQTYYKFFEDVLNYSLKNYDDNYKNDFCLKVYEKYSMKDFCKLFNWNYNDSYTIFGYAEKNDICPIFVNYEKDEDISENLNYEDKFHSNKILKWDSRDISANKGKEKKENELIKKFIEHENNNVKFYLFIKKSKNDKDDDYFYMGKVTPTNPVIPTEKPCIYKFDLELENPVKKDLYDYFTSPIYHDLK